MSQQNKGFTLVELLVVAPIVILVIGGFIGAIIAMTGNVLATRSDNQLAYDIQDALDRIESDVRISGGFLPTNNVTISNNQGKGDTSTEFAYNDPALILNSYATTSNPASSTRNIVYQNLPNSCGSGTANQNNPLMFNTVYFLDNSNTLWRRIVAPSNFLANTFCNAMTLSTTSAWQKPSCSTIAGSFCVSKDVRLVDGVTAFTISYYLPSAPGTLLTAPPSVANSGVVVTITAAGSAAGRNFTESRTVRATSPNNNFVAS